MIFTTKTYPGGVNVRRIRFTICPHDIVAVTSYPENGLEHTICVAFWVALRRFFTDRRDLRETIVSYTVSTVGDYFSTRSTRRNACRRFHRTICYTHILGFAGTRQRQLIHLRDIYLSMYHHLFNFLAGFRKDVGDQVPYTLLTNTYVLHYVNES